MRRLRRALPALLVGVLALGACTVGSDDGAAPAAPPEPGRASPPASADPVDPADPPGRAPAWPRVAPARAGFDAAALRDVAREARAAGSSCFLVAREGRVVGEWYWRDGAPAAPREVFSVTKSLTALLVGLAVDDGLLAPGDRVARYVPAWRGTPSAGVTVRDLLSGVSGRTWTQDDDYAGLLRATDRTAFALERGQDVPPGERWVYSNSAVQVLDAVLARVTGESTADYAQRRLLGPLGMTGSRMTADASGRSTNTAFGLQSTCRDLARLGGLVAGDGAVDGEQLLSRAWVRDVVAEPSQPLNAAYGLLWWLNRPGPVAGAFDQPGTGTLVAEPGQLAPSAPAEAVAALGFGGQVLLVDPTSRTVVVRLGDPFVSQRGADYSFADAARALEALRPAR